MSGAGNQRFFGFAGRLWGEHAGVTDEGPELEGVAVQTDSGT